ncbi:hypothetical protein E4T56_gene10928 [Termitomyces sp. T112]|nr:hypothetical protein E4T56_gene10928 [Termitomyces sp. T112]
MSCKLSHLTIVICTVQKSRNFKLQASIPWNSLERARCNDSLGASLRLTTNEDSYFYTCMPVFRKLAQRPFLESFKNDPPKDDANDFSAR